MPDLVQDLYGTINKTDPLGFWTGQQVNYAEVSRFLDLDKNELSKISGISKNSVRFDKKIPQILKSRLEEIAVICSLVAEYFEGNPVKTALWFRTPNPLLGDISPRDMIRLGRYSKLIKFITEARRHNGKKG